MLDHSAEHLGRCSNEGLALNQTLELNAKKAVTLNCAEAELCGIVKGTTEALGIQSVGRDLGLRKTLSIQTHSAAAVGICKTACIWRVRHLTVGQLWVQEGPKVMRTLLTR